MLLINLPVCAVLFTVCVSSRVGATQSDPRQYMHRGPPGKPYLVPAEQQPASTPPPSATVPQKSFLVMPFGYRPNGGVKELLRPRSNWFFPTNPYDDEGAVDVDGNSVEMDIEGSPSLAREEIDPSRFESFKRMGGTGSPMSRSWIHGKPGKSNTRLKESSPVNRLNYSFFKLMG
ncbi:hypothetical protein BV898_09472 [Hypsibius exemplaris]|uniref:Uncharacterized protein n=1 Tax=Hypsibius exemplaris TaxID=2072580 RepID=A0A1W0WMS8_HYPEX|nr:hypothetical protein BV898_09472 [Hypsibius exemplaris]